MNKNYVLAMSLLLLVSCGNRRPGMSKEEAAAELKEQAAQEEAVRKERAASVDTFAADYRPPAGIKYQAKIVTDGAKVLNIPVALKNVRELKPNELGVLSFHPTGYEGYAFGLRMMPVDDGWLMENCEGVYLLDKEMKLCKTLFKNDVKISEIGENGRRMYGIQMNRRLSSVGYDPSTRQLRGFYAGKGEKEGYEYAVVTLPWDALTESADPWTPEHLVGMLPSRKNHQGVFHVLEGGWLMTEPFSSRLYTFGLKGDTLCRFIVNDADDYVPTSTYRNGEYSFAYSYGGHVRLHMAYDDAVYELTDASTLKAVWRLDFGSLKRPTGKYVVSDLENNLDGYYFIHDWLETVDYLFIRLSCSHDSPNARSQGKVTLYTLVYDKRKDSFFTLSFRQNRTGEYTYSDFPFEVEGQKLEFSPSMVVGDSPALALQGRQLKEKLEAMPGLSGIGDNEVVLVLIEKGE